MRESAPRVVVSLSRRAVIGAAAAPAVGALRQAESSHSTAARCAAIVALDDEVAYLHRHYGDLESRLASAFNWFKLSEEAQCALPEAAEFNVVADRLPVAIQERDTLMDQAASYRVRNITDVIGKLAVAARCAAIGDEDDTTPAILNAVVREILRLNCPSCGAPLAAHLTP